MPGYFYGLWVSVWALRELKGQRLAGKPSEVDR